MGVDATPSRFSSSQQQVPQPFPISLFDCLFFLAMFVLLFELVAKTRQIYLLCYLSIGRNRAREKNGREEEHRNRAQIMCRAGFG
jgi:hypothetical protein